MKEIQPSKNRLKKIWKDKRQRVVLFAALSFVLNLLNAGYNAFLGIATQTAWFITMSVYYLILASMRYFAVSLEIKNKIHPDQENISREWKLLKRDGIMILILVFALSGTVVLTVKGKHVKLYNQVMMLTLTTFTFYKVIAAVINMIKARRARSPILIAIRNISLADAAMSILPMQTSMLALYMDETSTLDTHLMTVATGTGICIVFLYLGISMIILAGRNQNKRIS